MRRLLGILLALAAVGTIIGYRLGPARIVEKFRGWFAAGDEIPVRAVQVRRGSLVLEVYGSGVLRPAKEAEIASMVPGILEEIRYKVGDKVSAGQWVASIRATELIQRARQVEAALEAAQADLRETENRLHDVEKKLQQTRELRNQDLIAGKDLTEAETAAATARAQTELVQAQVAQHRASLEQVRYFLSFSKLVAPWSGVIMRRLSVPGTYLKRSEPVMALANLDVMRVTIHISQKDVDGIQRDMPARITVESLPGQVFEGRVVEIHPESEAGDANGEVEIHVANAEHFLKPEMRASVSLSTGEKRNVLSIPREAVKEIAGKPHVDVVMNGRVQRRTITVGRNQERTVEVVAGVREGDWVVVHSPSLLTANSRVRIAVEKADAER
jgi:RND family efflux transporter MFP subunit